MLLVKTLVVVVSPLSALTSTERYDLQDGPGGRGQGWGVLLHASALPLASEEFGICQGQGL